MEGSKPANNDGKKTTQPPRWRETLNYYRSSASIHGVAKIEPLYFFRPLIWVCLTVIMAVILIVMMYFQFSRYLSYPTFTKVNAILNNKLDFPAVTICNLNMFKKDIILCKGPEFEYSIYTMFEDMSDVSILEQFILFSGSTIQDISGKTLEECSKNNTQKLHRFIGYCVWEGAWQNCSEIFQETLTEYGVCFTFNRNLKWRRFTGSTGSTSGLHVLIDIEQDDYFFSKTSEAGVKTNALAPPFKGSGTEFCLDTEEPGFVNPLARYKHYSRMACISECDINRVVEMCGCRFFLDPGDEAICSLVDTRFCYIREQRSAVMSREYRENCSCPNTCSETKYATTTSYSKFGSDFINSVLRSKHLLPDDEHVRNNFLDVRIYYDSLMETETVQVPELTIEGILGNFGGLMGLFLGASLLSVSEVLELIFLLFYQRCQGSKEEGDKNEEEPIEKL
ncbi:hypothetical protein ScPMuIL_010720 [Solemya velum]